MMVFENIYYQNLGISFDEWDNYRKNMLKFRNEYVAHRPKVYDKPVPYFSLALNATICLESWVREQIKPDIIEDKPLSLIVAKNRKDIRSALLRVIRKNRRLFG
jgi:hypothetical protein